MTGARPQMTRFGRLLIIVGTGIVAGTLSLAALVALSWHDMSKWFDYDMTDVELVGVQPSLTRGFWVKYRRDCGTGYVDHHYWVAWPWRGIYVGNEPSWRIHPHARSAATP